MSADVASLLSLQLSALAVLVAVGAAVLAAYWRRSSRALSATLAEVHRRAVEVVGDGLTDSMAWHAAQYILTGKYDEDEA